MSEPPPGYNAGESMLQGGTATIVPVMGGGRIKRALKQIRKKRTRKGSHRKPNRTRRPKRRQAGGADHYAIPDIDAVFIRQADALITLTIGSKLLPTKSSILETVTVIDVVPNYLKAAAKLWVRKINAPFFSYSEFKSKIPTSDNIGCSSGYEAVYRADKLVRYAPDRLCCVLNQDTTNITVLPAIQGSIETFMYVVTALSADLEKKINYMVYIFSPPFFGNNTEANTRLFMQYLKYKNTVGKELNWRFYILMEHTMKNIEAAKLVSRDIATDFAGTQNKAAVQTLSNELTPKVDKIEATKMLGTELISSLHPMLEPSYIIYPYALNFTNTSATSLVGNVGRLTPDEYKKRLGDLDTKQAEAASKVAAAETNLVAAEKAFDAAQKAVWAAMNSHTTSAGNLSKLTSDVDGKTKAIDAITLKINSLGPGTERSNLEAQKSVLVADEARLKEALKLVKERDATNSKNYTDLQRKALEGQTAFNLAKVDKKNKETSLKASKTQTEKAKAALDAIKPLSGVKQDNTEEKGGLLFSAATKDEPILPAPYTGFDGAIKYVQTSDGNSSRGSIAYRADLSKREPLLDAMDYEEYNLLLAPPMNQQSMFTFSFKKGVDNRVITTTSSQEAFVENLNASHIHVPGVAVTVGTQDFVLRSPVPDVVTDWKDGIYTRDEAEYLNSMRLSPRVLKQVFGDSWKTQLSDHLSMISRSNCFKDPRLLLHADCQQAQGFVAQVLKYYMENSNEIIRAEQRDRDASTSLLQKKLDALAGALAANNNVSADSIFDVVPFIKTFYPRVDAAEGNYISSVAPTIRVNRTTATYIVTFSHDDNLDRVQKAAIETKLNVTFTIDVTTPPTATEDGVYTWTFDKEVNEYDMTKAARKQVSSFSVHETQPYKTISQRTIDVFYFGKLSPDDIALINKRIKFKERTGPIDPPLPSNVRRWDLEEPITEQGAKEYFKTIANTNTYNLTFTRNAIVDYSKVTVGAPSLDFNDNTLNLVFMMREVKSPGVDISAKLSVSLKTGLSIPNSQQVLRKEFSRISQEVNKLPRETAAFKGKYAISNPEQ